MEKVTICFAFIVIPVICLSVFSPHVICLMHISNIIWYPTNCFPLPWPSRSTYNTGSGYSKATNHHFYLLWQNMSWWEHSLSQNAKQKTEASIGKFPLSDWDWIQSKKVTCSFLPWLLLPLHPPRLGPEFALLLIYSMSDCMYAVLCIVLCILTSSLIKTIVIYTLKVAVRKHVKPSCNIYAGLYWVPSSWLRLWTELLACILSRNQKQVKQSPRCLSIIGNVETLVKCPICLLAILNTLVYKGLVAHT